MNWLLDRISQVAEDCARLPSYRTVRRSLEPIMRRWSLARINERNMPVDLRKSGAGMRRGRKLYSENPVEKVAVVLPSEWATRDVSFRPIWDAFVANSRSQVPLQGAGEFVFNSIDCSPIVRDREAVLNVENSIFLPSWNRDDSIRVGDDTRTTLSTSPPSPSMLTQQKMRDKGFVVVMNALPKLPSNVPQTFRESLRVQSLRNGHFELDAVARRTFMVEADLDSVETPFCSNEDHDKGPSSCFRNGHLGPGSRSLLRVGDICTFLDVSQEKDCICLVVQRHLRNEGPDFPTILLWVPVVRLPSSRSDERSYIYRQPSEFNFIHDFDHATFQMAFRTYIEYNRLSDRRFAVRSGDQIVSSFGKLNDGRRYFVYRILLYCDGFSQYKERKGFAGGCYILPLNLPLKVRQSSKAVRVLALTPPGVSTNSVLEEIIPDIVEGCTQGFEAVTPDGETIQIFWTQSDSPPTIQR